MGTWSWGAAPTPGRVEQSPQCPGSDPAGLLALRFLSDAPVGPGALRSVVALLRELGTVEPMV